MFASSVKPEANVLGDLGSIKAFLPLNFTWNNYSNVFERMPLFQYAFNSFCYAVVTIVVSLVVNSMAGYALARLNFPGKNIIFAFIVMFITIPIEIVMLPLFSIVFSLDWVDTYQGVIAPFLANALYIYLFRQFFLSIPKSLEEAAVIDGASTWTIFTKIIMPLCKPVYATVAILTFIERWNDFIWPALIITDEGKRTIQLGISTLLNLQPVRYGEIMAALTFTTIPVILVFVFFQKYIIQGLAHTGSKE